MTKNILLAFLAAIPLAFAQTTVENDFAALKKIRAEALAKAAEPIDRKFREESERLLAKAIQSGNLGTAEMIKRELLSFERGKPKTNGSRFENTFWICHGSRFVSAIKINSNGSIEESNWWHSKSGGEVGKFAYEVKENGIVVAYPWGKPTFKIGEKSMDRGDGDIWKKVTENEFKTFISGKESKENDTPFGRSKP